MSVIKDGYHAKNYELEVKCDFCECEMRINDLDICFTADFVFLTQCVQCGHACQIMVDLPHVVRAKIARQPGKFVLKFSNCNSYFKIDTIKQAHMRICGLNIPMWKVECDACRKMHTLYFPDWQVPSAIYAYISRMPDQSILAYSQSFY